MDETMEELTRHLDEPCPDCGDDPQDPTLHRHGCRRIRPVGDPHEALQFGPPWQAWPAGLEQ